MTPHTSVDPAAAAQLLASLPLHTMPRMAWTVTEVGSLTSHPPAHVPEREHRTAVAQWAAYFGLGEPAETGVGQVHLRVQGAVDGVLVTIWSMFHRDRARPSVYDQWR